MFAARCRRSESRRWCCTGATARGRASATAATWLSTSPTRGSSSSPEIEHVPYLGGVDALIGEVEEFMTGERAPRPRRAGAGHRAVRRHRRFDGNGGGDRGRAVAGAARPLGGLGRPRASALPRPPHPRHGRRDARDLRRSRRGRSAARWPMRDASHGLDLRVRTGLHAGEVELRDSDIGGIAVHLAARICAHASPDEVLVSSTVADLVAGSDLAFDLPRSSRAQGHSPRMGAARPQARPQCRLRRSMSRSGH